MFRIQFFFRDPTGLDSKQISNMNNFVSFYFIKRLFAECKEKEEVAARRGLKTVLKMDRNGLCQLN